MTEKPFFEKSGRVQDINDLAEIEYWGHDAGEFFWPEIREVLAEVLEENLAEESTSPSTRP